MQAIKEDRFLALMDFGGFSDWLEVVKRKNRKKEEYIVFCRNENHVSAWHCNTLPITDSQILEIKPMSA